MLNFRLWCPLALVLTVSLVEGFSSEEVQTVTEATTEIKTSNSTLTTKPVPADKLKVTIFYESLCPDCVVFFKDQLQPNYKGFAHYIKLDFVPYGNAEHTVDDKGNYNFTCQHGEPECKENKFQACAIDKLIKKHSSALNKFIICYMMRDKHSSAAQKCASKFKIDLKDVKSCIKSKAGDKALAKMGDRTHGFRPKVKWVPTIVFQDVFNEEDAMKAATNFKCVLCEKLNNIPEVCKE